MSWTNHALGECPQKHGSRTALTAATSACAVVGCITADVMLAVVEHVLVVTVGVELTHVVYAVFVMRTMPSLTNGWFMTHDGRDKRGYSTWPKKNDFPRDTMADAKCELFLRHAVLRGRNGFNSIWTWKLTRRVTCFSTVWRLKQGHQFGGFGET